MLGQGFGIVEISERFEHVVSRVATFVVAVAFAFAFAFVAAAIAGGVVTPSPSRATTRKNAYFFFGVQSLVFCRC